MRIYIAEDEPLAAAKLKLFLEKLGEGSDLRHFDNGVTALSAVLEQTPDLLFLDIHMSGLSGMEILARLAAEPEAQDLPVIITSAYDQYAIDSFGYNVTDYLLKPFTLERLEQALRKAKQTIRLQQLQRQLDSSSLSIRCDGKTEILQTSDILLLESLKDYVRIMTRDGRNRTVLGTLTNFEEQLPANDFMRIHRSYIINVHEIQEIGSSQIRLSSGFSVPVGKTYRSLLSSK